jgi:tetratricopeptide (TPR) repeat protein
MVTSSEAGHERAALQSAMEALSSHDFPAAAQALRSHVADHADPEARLELGEVLLMIREYDEGLCQLETAYREFTAAGLTKRSAIAAATIAVAYMSNVGNRFAARPWLARAWSTIEREEPCIEQGWVALMDVGCNTDDVEALRAKAEMALELARRFGDGDLEVKAMADSGLAMVEAGEVEAGMGRLDESMALITAGAVKSPKVAGRAVCSFFAACQVTEDLGRLESWSDVLRERRMVGDDGIPILTAHCELVYGTLMCSLGRWQQAETVLGRALERSHAGPRAPMMRAEAAQAGLRIRQGRLDEAELLLLGRDDYIDALIPMARLHLARADFDLAAATARRGLRMIGSDRLRAAQLLLVLTEAELGRGDPDAAQQAATQLAECAEIARSTALAAEAAFASARVLAARGENEQAIEQLDRALARMATEELPLLRATLHVELARLHATVDRSAAVAEARAAAAIHARIEAPLADDAIAVLQQLGVEASADGGQGQHPRRTRATLTSEGAWWTISSGPTSFRLRATKGLAYLADLLAHPGIERHVFDLTAITDPVTAEGEATRRSLGDAGPLLDSSAKAAYRRRVEELRDEIDRALLLDDHDRAASLQSELDALLQQLAQAVGLGGRDRRAASGAERARLNVTRALRAAIARVEQADRHAGAALDRRIQTGLFCSYQPDPNDTITWTLGPTHGQRRPQP